jgi:hypothetical protein
VAAAAGVLGAAAPASAASCTSGSGVTVVVDPGALGGALMSTCDSGSGQAASARYADAGVAITYVQRQPGFVCRVDGAPATDPCVNTPPTDAYWGLWWTDGTSGTWTYSSLGVTGLQVPEGGAVALAWQQGTARRTPAIAAPVHAAPAPSPTKSTTPKPSPQPAPKPTPTPTAQPTPTASPQPASPSAPTSSESASASASTSTSPSASVSSPASRSVSPGPGGRSGPRASRTPSRTPTDGGTTSPGAAEARSDASRSASPTDTPAAAQPADAADQQDRLPTWVTLAVLGALVVSLAAMALAARRRRGDVP